MLRVDPFPPRPPLSHTALYTYPLRVAFWVSLALAVLAVTLTLSGIYSVLSYLVAQRTKEIGIRMTLGATARLLVASPLGPFLSAIDVFDSAAYTSATVLVLGAALAASAMPAIRAARVDPIETLRHG